MKKLLLKLLLILLFIPFLFSCEKDSGVSEHDVIINVSYKYSKSPDFKPRFADNSIVMIFKDEGKPVDFENTSLLYDKALKFTDGTKSQIYEYVSNNLTGINTFEAIPNGSYILSVVYKPYDYIQYYSIKKIVITGKDPDLLIHNLTLDIDEGLGYQSWSEK